MDYNDDILIDRIAVDMLSDMQHVLEQNLHKICIVYIQFFPIQSVPASFQITTTISFIHKIILI
jgi:hypothetical protein